MRIDSFTFHQCDGLKTPGHGSGEKPPARAFLRAWYTGSIVIKGFIVTLLLAVGLWGSFDMAPLVKGTAALCHSTCTCGCCMHGGMCSMMAKGAPMRMELQSTGTSGSSRAQPGVACSCSLSQPVTALILASHAGLSFSLPHAKPHFKLPSSFSFGGSNFIFWPVAGNRLPDPPPKPFHS